MNGNISKDGDEQHYLTIRVCQVGKHSRKSGITLLGAVVWNDSSSKARIQLDVISNSMLSCLNNL